MGSQIERCTWDGERWTKADGAGCNEDHCAMRGRCANHVQHGAGIITCPSCIRRVRKDIDAIVLRAALLVYDAQAEGIDSEAMNLIGPTVHPDEATAATRADAMRGVCEWPATRMRAGDPNHPLKVLGDWEIALEDGGWLTRSALRITITGAATRLRGALDGGFPHGDEFETFAREIAACRSHLEDVDHDSRTPDLGRPCPTCVEASADGKGPRLRKRHASHPGSKPGQRCSDTLCAICTGRADAWHCPDDPAHAWTDEDYHARVDADYLEHAPALTADQLAGRFDQLRAGTVRVWANRGLVRKRGRDQHGRQLYDVADVQQRHALGTAS